MEARVSLSAKTRGGVAAADCEAVLGESSVSEEAAGSRPPGTPDRAGMRLIGISEVSEVGKAWTKADSVRGRS